MTCLSFPVQVYPLAVLPGRTNKYPQVTVTLPLAQRLEEVEILTIVGMVSDSPVPVSKLLIPYLSLPSVEEDAVLFPPVSVTVLLSSFSGKQEYEGLVGRVEMPLCHCPP